MKKVIFALSLTGLTVLFLVSGGCYYDKEALLYPASTCDTTSVTYTGTVSSIISSYCTSCHSTGAAASSGGGIILDNKTSLTTYANNGRLMGSLNHSSGYSAMPKNNGQLDACTRSKIQAWINSGAK